MTKTLKTYYTELFNIFAVFAIVIINAGEKDSNLHKTRLDIILRKSKEKSYSFFTWPASGRFGLRVASGIEGELDPTGDVTDTSSVLLLTPRLL
jgi:hypothetical protein